MLGIVPESESVLVRRYFRGLNSIYSELNDRLAMNKILGMKSYPPTFCEAGAIAEDWEYLKYRECANRRRELNTITLDQRNPEGDGTLLPLFDSELHPWHDEVLTSASLHPLAPSRRFLVGGSYIRGSHPRGVTS